MVRSKSQMKGGRGRGLGKKYSLWCAGSEEGNIKKSPYVLFPRQWKEGEKETKINTTTTGGEEGGGGVNPVSLSINVLKVRKIWERLKYQKTKKKSFIKINPTRRGPWGVFFTPDQEEEEACFLKKEIGSV